MARLCYVRRRTGRPPEWSELRRGRGLRCDATKLDANRRAVQIVSWRWHYPQSRRFTHCSQKICQFRTAVEPGCWLRVALFVSGVECDCCSVVAVLRAERCWL